MINNVFNLAKEAIYHFFEAKVKPNPFSYKIWAFQRIFKIVTRKTQGIESFLLPFDIYLSNRYGNFFIPKMSDFIITVSPIAEANLLPYFTLPSKKSIFLDIGANAGKYSVIIANNYPDVRIFSFEPSPFTYPVLLENIKINNIGSKVKPLNIGLSDKEDNIEFAVSSTFTGVSHIVDTSTGQYDRFSYDHVSVSVKSLDQIVFEEKINPELIYLIKIDVEGHELNVLHGAVSTIKMMPGGAKILIEIHPDLERINLITELLESYDFTKKQIDPENYVFLRK